MELVLNGAMSNPEGASPFMSDLSPDSNVNNAVSLSTDEDATLTTQQITDTEKFLDIFNQQIVDLPTEPNDSDETLFVNPVIDEPHEDDKDQQLDFINLYFPMEPITPPNPLKNPMENKTFNEDQNRIGGYDLANRNMNAQIQKAVDVGAEASLESPFTTLDNPLTSLLGLSTVDSGNSTPIAPEALFAELDNSALGEQQVTVLLPDINNTTVQTSSAPNERSPYLRLEIPVTDNTWANEFAERIVFVSQQPVKTAIMHINPPELGPLEISVSMKQDKAAVQITSQHPLIRDLIESSFPKLRDLFQEQGLQLTDSTVSKDSQMNHHSKKPDPNDNPYYHSEQQGEVITIETPSSVLSHKQLGAVDYYI